MRERGYLVDIATDLLDDRLLLGGRGGDLVGKIRDLVYLDHNLIQVAGTCPGGGEAGVGSGHIEMHHLFPSPQGLLDMANAVLDLLCRLVSSGRQAANFVRHHRKAAPLIACPCGFDGGIERQQVGLIRNAANFAHDGADPLGLARQLDG